MTPKKEEEKRDEYFEGLLDETSMTQPKEKKRKTINPPCGNCHKDHEGRTWCRKEDLYQPID